MWALCELWRVVFNVHTGTFFINGWQSWGFTGALHPHQRQPDIATPGETIAPHACTIDSASDVSRQAPGGAKTTQLRQNYHVISSSDAPSTDARGARALPDTFSAAFHRGARTPSKAGRHSHMFAAIARGGSSSPALVAGFLSQKHQFGAVTSDRRYRQEGG